jgi:hypothetical protein
MLGLIEHILILIRIIRIWNQGFLADLMGRLTDGKRFVPDFAFHVTRFAPQAMLNANKLISQGRGLSRVLLDRAATVRLQGATQSGPRFEAIDSQGRGLQVSLPDGIAVHDGDVLVAEDGSLIRVESDVAAPAESHDHNHDHGHVHGPDCGHDHGHAAVEIKPAHQPHVHGPGCNHDH